MKIAKFGAELDLCVASIAAEAESPELGCCNTSPVVSNVVPEGAQFHVVPFVLFEESDEDVWEEARLVEYEASFSPLPWLSIEGRACPGSSLLAGTLYCAFAASDHVFEIRFLQRCHRARLMAFVWWAAVCFGPCPEETDGEAATPGGTLSAISVDGVVERGVCSDRLSSCAAFAALPCGDG